MHGNQEADGQYVREMTFKVEILRLEQQLAAAHARNATAWRAVNILIGMVEELETGYVRSIVRRCVTRWRGRGAGDRGHGLQ